MQNQRPKILLYQERSFGEKITAVFDFLKENWRLWLQGLVYLLLPVSLLQAFALNGVVDSALDVDDAFSAAVNNGYMQFGMSYIGNMSLMGLGMLLVYAFCFTLMRYYHESETRLQGVTLRDLKPLLVQNLKRILLLALVQFGSLVLFGLLFFAIVMSAPVLPLLLLVVGVVVMIPFSLSAPVYLFEDDETVFSVIRRALNIGFPAWWSTFAVLFVMGLMVSVLQSVISVPWCILFIVKMIFTLEENGNAFVNSGIYSFLLYLLGVVQTFGVFLLSSFLAFALGYQYGDIVEEVDQFSVDEDIENFNQL